MVKFAHIFIGGLMLELIPWLMLTTAVIFLGLIVYLNGTLYKPLLSFMDQRDRSILAGQNESENLTSSSEELLKQADELLNSAKQEALTIRQSAIENAKSHAEELIGSKEAELEKAYNEFLQKLEVEKDEVKSNLQSQLPLIKESIKAKFAQL